MQHAFAFLHATYKITTVYRAVTEDSRPFSMKLAVLVVTVIRATPIINEFALAVEPAALQLAIIGSPLANWIFPLPLILPLKNTHQLIAFFRL